MWWSIFILDKLVSMGSRRRCLVPDPESEGRLPVDDEAWVATYTPTLNDRALWQQLT